MAIDERSRHELFLALEQVLGREHATVLMEHLPPVGWADVATKRDLEQLELRLEAKIKAEIDASARRLMTTMVVANSASILTVGGLVLAAG
jgi:hypothetical protein